MLGESGPERLRCSRRGCEADATREIVWRNPRIHAEDREKIWLSCPEHEQFFLQYLGQRDFPVHSRARGVTS